MPNGSRGRAADIWVFVEQRDGAPADVGLEILGAARSLAERMRAPVSALLLGHRLAGHAATLFAHGADRVFAADDPRLERYGADAFAAILCDLAREHEPQVLLLGATALGRDLAPIVAARLRTGLCADCIGLDVDAEGRLLPIAPVLGGKELAVMLCPVARPQMATVRPGVFSKSPRLNARGEIVPVPVPPDLPSRVRVLGSSRPQREDHDRPLGQADVVVAGGAGIAGEEGWRLVRELADVLGAAIGGTRPPMDDGYLREDQMIGQSGVTIRPKLYFAIAISGDIQHTVGFQDAGVVVAINSDPAAPIFKVADYGIVGDYRQVLPALIAQLKATNQA